MQLVFRFYLFIFLVLIHHYHPKIYATNFSNHFTSANTSDISRKNSGHFLQGVILFHTTNAEASFNSGGS